MDADNRIPPYFLQGVKYRLEALNPDILSTWIQAETSDTKDQAIATIVNLYIEMQKTTNKPSVLEAMMCFKKDVFLRLGGFETSRNWGEGGEILERALRKKFRFEVVRDPKFTYSLRRLRAQGTLKSTRTVARLELARLLSKRLPKQNFKQPTEKQVSRLRRLVQRLYRGTPDDREQPKHWFLDRLFGKKA